METDESKSKKKEDVNARRRALGLALGYDVWELSQRFDQLHVSAVVSVNDFC